MRLVQKYQAFLKKAQLSIGTPMGLSPFAFTPTAQMSQPLPLARLQQDHAAKGVAEARRRAQAQQNIRDIRGAQEVYKQTPAAGGKSYIGRSGILGTGTHEIMKGNRGITGPAQPDLAKAFTTAREGTAVRGSAPGRVTQGTAVMGSPAGRVGSRIPATPPGYDPKVWAAMPKAQKLDALRNVHRSVQGWETAGGASLPKLTDKSPAAYAGTHVGPAPTAPRTSGPMGAGAHGRVGKAPVARAATPAAGSQAQGLRKGIPVKSTPAAGSAAKQVIKPGKGLIGKMTGAFKGLGKTLGMKALTRGRA